MRPSNRKPRRPRSPNKHPESSANTLRLGRSSIKIIYEDRSLMAIDKPPGWLITTPKWSRTQQNLQREIELGILRGDDWARQRQIRYLRFVHRLDRETSGVLLLAKNRHNLSRLSRLFTVQAVSKAYLCIVKGRADSPTWQCTAPLAPVSGKASRMTVNRNNGKPAETHFQVLHASAERSLVVAFPRTGRTHQIRVHLKHSGLPILGDPLYGPPSGHLKARPRKDGPSTPDLALRAWGLRFLHPQNGRPILIEAETNAFLKNYPERLPKLDLAALLNSVPSGTKMGAPTGSDTDGLSNPSSI